jgi:Apea-like HEPN
MRRTGHVPMTRFIDLIIAAEALFLGADAGTELGYRLALRGACFLESDAAARRLTLRFFKDAYDTRSRIAHGAGPRQGRMHTLEASESVPLAAFAAEIEAVMRRALRKAIAHIDTHGAFYPTNKDSDDLILDRGTDDGRPTPRATPNE